MINYSTITVQTIDESKSVHEVMVRKAIKKIRKIK